MFKIQTLNNISPLGLERLPRERYEVASEFRNPDAILLRSHDMHDMDISKSVKAVGRAGAGVNNIPVERLSQYGVPVFNAPGANANAVKELVIAGMLLAARNICAAWDYARALEGDEEALSRQVEAGKKKFRGFELPGRTLGVIGLGAIGVKVANAARDLGMRVLGYDPSITVNNAWRLNAGVDQALSVDDLVTQSDFITVHVPLNDATRDMISAERLRLARKRLVLMNFARDGIVDLEAVKQALDEERVQAYVSDFPNNRLKGHPRAIMLPHLGASTQEAEDNCAVMVADQVRDFLEQGNVRNSVNFPEAIMPVNGDYHRIAIVNANVPNMVGQISTTLAEQGLNIEDLLNKSKSKVAYTLVDVDSQVPTEVLGKIGAIDGVLSARALY